MDQNQRRARVISMRKARPLRRPESDDQPSTPCTATEPDPTGGPPYTCALTTHPGSAHFDEQRQVRWLPDPPPTTA